MYGIKSERTFLAHVTKDIKRNKGKPNALLAFAVTRFKKTVFTRYGYEKGGEVLGIVYSSFNVLKRNIHS